MQISCSATSVILHVIFFSENLSVISVSVTGLGLGDTVVDEAVSISFIVFLSRKDHSLKVSEYLGGKQRMLAPNPCC